VAALRAAPTVRRYSSVGVQARCTAAVTDDAFVLNNRLPKWNDGA
jgi:hypothetical protein